MRRCFWEDFKGNEGEGVLITAGGLNMRTTVKLVPSKRNVSLLIKNVGHFASCTNFITENIQ